MVSLSFGKRREKRKERNKGENLGNGKTFPYLNNEDLSGCFGNFLQWLIIYTVGEGKRKTRSHGKQIQIVFQETEFQPQFWVGSTTIKVWLIYNQTLINSIFL
jgi:hypothetical protein